MSLEYGSLWLSPNQQQSDNLEKVQRKISKDILKNSYLNYNDRLSILKLEPLSTRRYIKRIDRIIQSKLAMRNANEFLSKKFIYTYC